MNGYDAMMTLARQHPEWLPAIRACLAYPAEEFAAKWVLRGQPRTLMTLMPLARAGFLRNVNDSSKGGHKAYYKVIDPEGAQLSLHESREPGPVVPVEDLQRFDLLLKALTLGGQAPDHVLVPLLGLMLEFVGVRLGVLADLLRAHSRLGQELVGVPAGVVVGQGGNGRGKDREQGKNRIQLGCERKPGKHFAARKRARGFCDFSHIGTPKRPVSTVGR